MALGVEASLADLSLASSNKSKKRLPQQQTLSVADSWDEEVSSASDVESEVRGYANDFPSAPPPTPMSPTSSTARGGWGEFENPYSPSRSSDASPSPIKPSLRPEKQTAVAGRMIAGALGVRAPRKTEEQMQYEKAIKEKELRRREKERNTKAREEEDARKAKAAMWDS